MDMTGCFFAADYRDGQVYFGGKKYPAGHFTVQLMNQYYVNDTAARIAVYRDSMNYHILERLRDGYLYVNDYVRAGNRTQQGLKAFPRLPPFGSLDTESILREMQTLFTEENGYAICDYLRYRGEIASLDQNTIYAGSMNRAIDRDYMSHMEELIRHVSAILRFFDRLADDLLELHQCLSNFVSRLNEVERLDEAHLLPLALEIFGTPELPYRARYIATPKTRRSKTAVVSRRLSFDRYYSFIITDFFEGLHYGHYLRRCPICKKYFLMQSARRTVYCSGLSPYVVREKRMTCRAYGAYLSHKEHAKDDPVTDIYMRRCAAIRSEASRGTISKRFASAAKKLAKDHKQMAQSDHDYAVTQYEKDMTREKLYYDTGIRIKGGGDGE